jgi:hypothetical protein
MSDCVERFHSKHEHPEHPGVRHEVASQVDAMRAKAEKRETPQTNTTKANEPNHVDFSRHDIYAPEPQNSYRGFSSPNWGLDSTRFTPGQTRSTNSEKADEAKPLEQPPSDRFTQGWHKPAWGLDPHHFSHALVNLPGNHNSELEKSYTKNDTQSSESSPHVRSRPDAAIAGQEVTPSRTKMPDTVGFGANQLEQDLNKDGRDLGDISKVGSVTGAALDASKGTGAIVGGAASVAKGAGKLGPFGEGLQLAGAAKKAADGDITGAATDSGRVVASRVGGLLGGIATAGSVIGEPIGIAGGSYAAGQLYDKFAKDGVKTLDFLDNVDW